MNRVFLLSTAFMCLSLASFCQEGVFIGIGINQATIRNRNLNEIYQRYNDANPWSTGFDTFNHIGGVTLEASILKEQTMMSMGWCTRNKTKFAEGTDTLGAYQEIHLKNKYNYFYLNYFWHIVNEDHLKLGPGIGAGLGSYKIQRSNTTHEYDLEYYDVIRQHQLLTSVLINMSVYMGDHVCLSIQPYFQIPFLQNTLINYTTLENDINPRYSISDEDIPSYLEWPWNYGFTIALSFGGE